MIAEADAATAREPAGERADATDLPFVTIDPEGSTTWTRRFTSSAGAGSGCDTRSPTSRRGCARWCDRREARERVETLYAPDGRTPLHPPLLSEGAASLLPDQVAPALLWTIDLDAEGAPVRSTCAGRRYGAGRS